MSDRATIILALAILVLAAATYFRPTPGRWSMREGGGTIYVQDKQSGTIWRSVFVGQRTPTRVMFHELDFDPEQIRKGFSLEDIAPARLSPEAERIDPPH